MSLRIMYCPKHASKPEEELLIVAGDPILTSREALQVRRERRVLIVVYQGCLDLHASVGGDHCGHVLLEQPLDQDPAGVPAQVAGVGGRLIVDQFVLTHQPDMRCSIFCGAGALPLVGDQVAQPLIGRTRYLVVIHRHVAALWLVDPPLGAQRLLSRECGRLRGGGGGLIGRQRRPRRVDSWRRGPRQDGPRQLRQGVSLVRGARCCDLL